MDGKCKVISQLNSHGSEYVKKQIMNHMLSNDSLFRNNTPDLAPNKSPTTKNTSTKHPLLLCLSLLQHHSCNIVSLLINHTAVMITWQCKCLKSPPPHSMQMWQH